jgi:hypothetical protein
MPLDLLGVLAQPLFLLVDDLPWIPKLARLMHALVVSGHPALGALDHEEVLDPSRVFSLEEALLLHLLGCRVRKPVAVLLAHHDNSPVTAPEAVGSGFLAVAKEAVQFRLERHGKLPKALVQVLFISLWLSAKETRSKPAFIGGMVAIDGGKGHVAQLLLPVGLGAGDHERPLLVIRRQDIHTAGCQPRDLVVCIVRHAQDPSFIDGLRRALGLGDAVRRETLARAKRVVRLVRRRAGDAASIVICVVPWEGVFV